ncbi:OmpA family protein [Flavobacterium orientale]|uniref:OmpA family outer membrane protein n=1 Tax=Flavobacterium orientale TaxID=1756020 RepID=A0A916Y0U5_9FLAO|nr:OmpA family protein [Flavobacterium orientale]GGD25597.1 OmpA family outer membrane protein [Flavobacterium orientale]
MKQLFFIAFSLLFGNNISAQEKFEIFFDFNASIPNQVSLTYFEKWMQNNKNAEILELHGHCDSVDTQKYNLILSQKRINEVLQILKNNAIQINEGLQKIPYGKNFKQSKIQAENRKVVVFYRNLNVDSEDKSKANVWANRSPLLFDDPLIPLREKIARVKKGDRIRLEGINFHFNTFRVVKESEPSLDELVEVLNDNPNLKIEIQGHMCCNENTRELQLSIQRSRFIYRYLVLKGIEKKRISYKGFGTSKPIFTIPEKNEEERAKNRRVEIEIMEN